jgi:Fe-Mn family superoxide dismutase
MRFRLPVLPWGSAELQPFLSSEAVECHYFGHHKGYIDKVNELEKKLGLKDVSLEKLILNYDGVIFDNAAQAWNHTFFWLGLAPKSSVPSPNGALMDSVRAQFGTLEGLKERFIESASNLFGSGWTWIVRRAQGDIDILNTHNADNPMRFEDARPLWVCDVWEHAYYIDYRNMRAEFLAGAWKHINWAFVEHNFQLEHTPDMTRLMRNEPPQPDRVIKT